MSQTSSNPATLRLPFKEKLAYGLGDLGSNILLDIGTLYLLKLIKNGKAQGEVVFKKRTSLIFKSLQVVRFYDEKRNTLAYLAYSDKVVDGSPKNAISAVPVMPWRQ